MAARTLITSAGLLARGCRSASHPQRKTDFTYRTLRLRHTTCLAIALLQRFATRPLCQLVKVYAPSRDLAPKQVTLAQVCHQGRPLYRGSLLSEPAEPTAHAGCLSRPFQMSAQRVLHRRLQGSLEARGALPISRRNLVSVSHDSHLCQGFAVGVRGVTRRPFPGRLDPQDRAVIMPVIDELCRVRELRSGAAPRPPPPYTHAPAPRQTSTE
jgi:hypothetical protein